MKTETVYISGKVSGETYLSCYKKFEDAEKALTERGYKVINPMKICKSDWSWYRCMIVCLFYLRFKTDFIYFLPDWEDSKGAKIEKRKADKWKINELILGIIIE